MRLNSITIPGFAGRRRYGAHARLMIRKNDNSPGRYPEGPFSLFPNSSPGGLRGRANLSTRRRGTNKPASRIDSPTTRPTSNLPIPRERMRKLRLNYGSVASPLEIERDFSATFPFSPPDPIFPVVNESNIGSRRRGRWSFTSGRSEVVGNGDSPCRKVSLPVKGESAYTGAITRATSDVR